MDSTYKPFPKHHINFLSVFRCKKLTPPSDTPVVVFGSTLTSPWNPIPPPTMSLLICKWKKTGPFQTSTMESTLTNSLWILSTTTSLTLRYQAAQVLPPHHSLPTHHLATMDLFLFPTSHKTWRSRQYQLCLYLTSHKAQRQHHYLKSRALTRLYHLFGELCPMVAGSWGVYWSFLWVRCRAYRYVGFSILVTTTYKLLQELVCDISRPLLGCNQLLFAPPISMELWGIALSGRFQLPVHLQMMNIFLDGIVVLLIQQI